MGKISAFSVHFDPPQAVFFAGRSLTGYVLLDLKEPMKMKGLCLKLSGKGYVNWKDRKTTHTGKELIIKDTQTLFGDSTESGSSPHLHPSGRTTYPFTYHLPSHLPSSFESRHGFIRYVLKAKIEKPWKLDRKVQCPVEVNQLIDTNDPKYREGAGRETQKRFSSFCCIGGVVYIGSSIDRTCYCAGETILINANVKNSTFKSMGKLRAKLVQTVTYNAPGGSTNVSTDVTLLPGPSIRRRKHERWENQPLNIPVSTTLTITNSKLISVRYKLLILVGESVIVGNDFNIVIGTVPYIGNIAPVDGNLEMPPPYPSAPQDYSVGPIHPPLVPPDGSFIDPPPYSLEQGDESLGQKEDSDHHILTKCQSSAQTIQI